MGKKIKKGDIRYNQGALAEVLRYIDQTSHLPACPPLKNLFNREMLQAQNRVDQRRNKAIGRTEWLGDKLLSIMVGTMLYNEFREYSSGLLTVIHSMMTCNITFAKLAFRLNLADNPYTKEAANLFEVWTLLYFNEEGWQPLQDWVTALFTPLALVAHYSGLRGGSRNSDSLSMVLSKPDPRIAQRLAIADVPLVGAFARRDKALQSSSAPNIAGASLNRIAVGPLGDPKTSLPIPPERNLKPIPYTMEGDVIVLGDSDSEDDDDDDDPNDPSTTTSIYRARVIAVSDRNIEVFAEEPSLRGVIKLSSPYVKDSIYHDRDRKLRIQWIFNSSSKTRRSAPVEADDDIEVIPGGNGFVSEISRGDYIKVLITTTMIEEFSLHEMALAHPFDE